MAKIIEAKAVISAEDKTGAVFDKIAKKIEGIAKSAKSSVAVDKLSKALENAQKQMAAIDKFGAARGGFADARLRFREAEMAVARAAAAMKRGEGDARSLQRAYENAQKAVSNASAAFERQKTAVIANKRALDEMGIPANRAIQHQNNLRAAIDRTNASLERQPGRLSRAASATARGIGNIAPFAGPAILRGTKEAVKSGAEIQSEIVKMRAAGIPESDISRAVQQSAELGSKYTNVKRSTSLERFKELRSVLLHPEEAHEMLDPTVRANAAMNAIDKTGQLSEGLGFAIKGAEVLGLTQNKERYQRYLDSFIKAQQVMGKMITPEQQYEFAKYAKASGSTLSDRFKMTTGVSLAQELGGQTTGQSVDMFVKQLTGGFQGNQHSAAKEFVAMGLANKSDFETTKTGEIKGMKPGRKVPHSDLAQTDPDRYVYDYLLPAFEKKGITDQNAQIAQVRRMFPAGRSADFVAKLLTQRQSFENHAKLYGQAQGLGAIETNQTDPFVALNSFKTSLENFAGTLTSPAMQSAAGVLSSMASSLGSWGEALAGFQKDHPELSKGMAYGAMGTGAAVGGFATYSLLSGIMTGFGLPAASIQLSTSAAALSAAAAELSGAAAIQGGGGAAAAAGGGVFAAGAAALPFVAAGAGIAGGLYAMHKSVGDAGYEGMTSGERLRSQRGGSMRDVYRRAFGYNDFDAPEVSSTMTYGTGIRGDKGLTATLTGSAEVKGEIDGRFEVVAGSSLLSLVESVKRMKIGLEGTLNANGPGSTGLSSPDARAPVFGGRSAPADAGATGDY